MNNISNKERKLQYKTNSKSNKSTVVYNPVIINDFEKQLNVMPPILFWETGTNNIPIYEISSPHLLSQFVGYCKYANRKNGRVLIRGQGDLYGNKLVPSIARNRANIEKSIRVLREKNKEFIERHGGDDIGSSILQHYGIKTEWLDVVDNLWVALWFASHQFVRPFTLKENHDIKEHLLYTNSNEHLHVKCRELEDNAYILLLLSDAKKEITPGVYQGSISKLIDLRKAISSIFLRPHSQHALTLKLRNNEFEYTKLIIGIAKVKVRDALSWLGNSPLTSVDGLFPPPFFDLGYRTLLEDVKFVDDKSYIKHYGSITIIS